jgi:HEAT repeat protein
MRRVLAACLFAVVYGAGAARAQAQTVDQAVTAEQLQPAIDALGTLDYAKRAAAAQTVRRATPTLAVPVLLRAVAEHSDGYVRYRALVLLVGFNDPRTKDAMREALASPNDRLRTVAYQFFEHDPDAAVVPQLLKALDSENAEFVRPALVRALAAAPANPQVHAALAREVGRGEDFFRSAVIEALGDYRAKYAFDALAAVAKLDGPLLDDTALSLGKLGDMRAQDILAGLQRSAPQAAQPAIAAGICLLSINCDVHEKFLADTLTFSDRNSGYQDLLRGAASGLAALGLASRPTAVQALLTAGVASSDPTRAPVALALASVALRNPPVVLTLLEQQPRLAEAVSLLAEGFDMLDEDLDKERFFALARRTYWEAAEGSPKRALMESLIGTLDF